MANVPKELFREWFDGETIDAKTYIRERELLRVAINDNNDNVQLKQDKATALRLYINLLPPTEHEEYTLWFQDLGEGYDLSAMLILANASLVEGEEDVWFEQL